MIKLNKIIGNTKELTALEVEQIKRLRQEIPPLVDDAKYSYAKGHTFVEDKNNNWLKKKFYSFYIRHSDKISRYGIIKLHLNLIDAQFTRYHPVSNKAFNYAYTKKEEKASIKLWERNGEYSILDVLFVSAPLAQPEPAILFFNGRIYKHLQYDCVYEEQEIGKIIFICTTRSNFGDRLSDVKIYSGMDLAIKIEGTLWHKYYFDSDIKILYACQSDKVGYTVDYYVYSYNQKRSEYIESRKANPNYWFSSDENEDGYPQKYIEIVNKARLSQHKQYRKELPLCYCLAKIDTKEFMIVEYFIKKKYKLQIIKNLFDDDGTVNYKVEIDLNDKYSHSVITEYLNRTKGGAQIYGVSIGEVARCFTDSPLVLFQQSHSAIEVSKKLLKAFGNYENVVERLLILYTEKDFYFDPLKHQYMEEFDSILNNEFKEMLDNDYYFPRWKNEFMLYKLLVRYFPEAQFQYRAKWLGMQSLDMYIPSIKIAIEYQGEQHYIPVDFFGGEDGLEERKQLDEQKKEICAFNNVTLIEWHYKTPITSINLVNELRRRGIASLPVVDVDIVENFERSSKNNNSANRSKTVIRQYSQAGIFIKEYPSIKEAAKFVGVSTTSINNAIYGKQKTAKSSMWRRVNAKSKTENIKPLTAINANTSKPVIQICKTNDNVIANFSSISQASKATGISSKSIRSVLGGVQNTAGGFFWAYAEIS